MNMNELRTIYESLTSVNGIDKETLNGIQTTLNVRLPEDFCEITAFFGGGLLGGISNHSFSNFDSPNIIDETVRLRDSINLPLEFVVLAEPDESLIVMDTQRSPSIIWCDAIEVSKLKDKAFISKPDEWNTYTEFFAQLLKDEEEEQRYYI